MKKFLTYFAIATFTISCASRKVTTHLPTSTSVPVENTDAFYSAIATPIQFDVVKMSSRVNVRNGKFIPTLNATFYIEKDKKVWANITAFMGLFGGARGLATPNGIQAYEKINNTYIDSDFSYLNNLLGVNFVTFDALQKMLVGRTFVPVSESDFTLTKSAQGYQLTSTKVQEVRVNGKKAAYNVRLNYDAQYRLNQVEIDDASSDHHLRIAYSNWNRFGESEFPVDVKINIKTDKTDEILIENTNFDFSRMDTPYSVPANYKKTVIK